MQLVLCEKRKLKSGIAEAIPGFYISSTSVKPIATRQKKGDKTKQYTGFCFIFPSYPSFSQIISELTMIILHGSFIYPSCIFHGTVHGRFANDVRTVLERFTDGSRTVLEASYRSCDRFRRQVSPVSSRKNSSTCLLVLEYPPEGTPVLYMKVLEYFAWKYWSTLLRKLEFHLEETGETYAPIYFMNWCFLKYLGAWIRRLI